MTPAEVLESHPADNDPALLGGLVDDSNERVDFRYQPEDSWTAICHPDDADKTLVRGDGALLYGYRRTTWLSYGFDRVIEFGLAGHGRLVAVRQKTELPTSAIVETTLEYQSATLRLLTFRHWADGRGFDVVQWEVGTGPGDKEVPIALRVEIFDRISWFTSGPHGASRRIYEVGEPELALVEWMYDAPDPAAAEWRLAGGHVAAESFPERLAVAESTGFRPVAAFTTLPEHVHGGSHVAGVVVIPLDGREVDGLDERWAPRALVVEQHYWGALFPEGFPLNVPDDGIQALLEASARNMLQAREQKGDNRVLQVGHAIYRDFWIADGYFMLEAARYIGLDDVAEASLAHLENYVGGDGSIVALRDLGHTKETAIAIAMLVRQAELAGQLDRLVPSWPRIESAVDHIASLHESTLALPASSPERGLMPPSFADGGAGGLRCEYTTMLWCLAGLRIVIGAARQLGRPELARFEEVYDRLGAAFQQHARAHTQPLAPGHNYLPMVLGSGSHRTQPGATVVAVEDHIRPETATWALAHAIYPGEVFQPDDDLVRDYLYLLDLRDDDEHIPATTGWLPYRALWTYYASFAAHAFLWAGRADKAIEYLYGFANHASPTGVWREEQPMRGAGHTAINGDMPHNWASAEFIRLVRNLLVFERGNDLLVLPAVPAKWLAQGKPISAATPTRFGRVRLEVRPGAPTGRIEVYLEPGAVPVEHLYVHIPPGDWDVFTNEAQMSQKGPQVLEVGDQM